MGAIFKNTDNIQHFEDCIYESETFTSSYEKSNIPP